MGRFLALAAAQLLWEAPSQESEPLLGAAPAPQPKTNIVQPTLCDAGVKQEAGHIQIAEDKALFFWLFESRNAPATDPVVMWLTGGPGCSSQLALLSENGPCALKPGSSTETENNPFSWNSRATMLWVDQPAGTGFSVGPQSSYDHNETQVGNDMLAFLDKFFDMFPQYNHDFYVFGESYGGHWVPVVTHRVFKANQNSELSRPIALKGWSVGNGLTDPATQYPYYPQMAYDSGSAPRAVTKEVYEEMLKAVAACEPLIVKCNLGDEQACADAYMNCNQGLVGPYAATGLNTYDMRIKCAKPPLCYDFSNATSYLNSAVVQKALGVSGDQWQSCNFGVNGKFQTDFLKGYAHLVPDMLEAGLRVLIYAGDVDYICNWLGNQAWTKKLAWSGHDQFNAAEEAAWSTSDGRQAGKLRKYKNFSFLQVFQAGHMVPLDQPRAALELFNEFLGDKLGSQDTEIYI